MHMEELGVIKKVEFDKRKWISTFHLDNKRVLKVSGDFRHIVGFRLFKNGTKFVYRRPEESSVAKQVTKGLWIGSVVGETSTTYIEAQVRQNSEQDVSILDFVFIEYKNTHILGQITDYKRRKDGTAVIGIALIGVINGGKLERVAYPVMQGTKVYKATVSSIESAFNMDSSGMYIGLVHNTHIPVYINKKMMSIGHTAILAKIRTGKSYLTRVFAEEINKQGYPIVILDPRAEYSFAYKNDTEEELKLMSRFKIRPESFKDRYVRFVFDEEKTPNDVLVTQDMLRKDEFYNLLVRPSQISVVDLNSVKSSQEELNIVSTISNNLLEARKHDKIPPTFLVVEEAEKYIPEGSKSSPSLISISDIAMQGAQKGLDLIVVGHRPSKIKKDILSQCFNFSILQVSWDNDKQRIKQSVEDASQYIDIISTLPVGTAFLSGAYVNRPLLVDVRVAHTKHFGQTVETNVAYSEEPKTIKDIKSQLSKLAEG